MPASSPEDGSGEGDLGFGGGVCGDMAGVSGLATGAGACGEAKAGETKVLEVVVDEVCRVTVFNVVDGVDPAGSTELLAAVVEVSSGPEGCDAAIEVVKVVGARVDGFISDRVLDSVLALPLKDEVAMLVKLVSMLLLAGTVLLRRTFVHRLPRNVVMEDIWRAPRDAWGDHGEAVWG